LLSKLPTGVERGFGIEAPSNARPLAMAQVTHGRGAWVRQARDGTLGRPLLAAALLPAPRGESKRRRLKGIVPSRPPGSMATRGLAEGVPCGLLFWQI